MTMRNPLIDAEINIAIPETFDPAKKFRFTWPGQPPRVIGGKELSEICRGADVSKLAIEPVEDAPVFTSTRPSFREGGDR